jgi:hypothetical protein
MLDLFKPVYYSLEKSVAAKSIPAVHEILGRKKLADFNDSTLTGTVDHSKWDGVLKRHVKMDGTVDGITNVSLVDYNGISQDVEFGAYLNILEHTDVTSLAHAEELAFWINAYNALCINLVVQHERIHRDSPLTSINNLSEKGKPVWDKIAGVVGGQEVSLNHVEHERLRKVWDEPAIHGCIVCASASCPNLRDEAFVASQLKEQMSDQMKDWMNNDTKGLKLYQVRGVFGFGGGGNRLQASRIFLWFSEDFGGLEAVNKWIPQFVADDGMKQSIIEGSPAVRFFDYSWKINRAR